MEKKEGVKIGGGRKRGKESARSYEEREKALEANSLVFYNLTLEVRFQSFCGISSLDMTHSAQPTLRGGVLSCTF